MSGILGSEMNIDSCLDLFMLKMEGFPKSGKAFDIFEWFQWYVLEQIIRANFV